MSEIERAIYQRNARFRAWRAYGVPVGGGWEMYVADDAAGTLTYFGFLKLRCTCCRRDSWYSHDGKMSFAQAEQMAVWRLVHPAPSLQRYPCRHYPCPHLAPLLGEEPLEVRAIYELELLAGGGA